MQKTESQLSGYLYRRSNDNTSWSNRFATLSIDSGTLKFYMEKSGKRTLKDQLNVRKSKLVELSFEKVGKPLTFQLQLLEESVESNFIISAADQDQYFEWKHAIEVSIETMDQKIRREIFAKGPDKTLAIEKLEENVKNKISSQSDLGNPEAKPESKESQNSEETGNLAAHVFKEIKDETVAEQRFNGTLSSIFQSIDETEISRPMTIEVATNKDDINNGSSSPTPLEEMTTIIPSFSFPSPVEGAKTPLLSELQRKMMRKSFLIPSNLGNLLTSVAPKVEQPTNEIQSGAQALDESQSEPSEGIAELSRKSVETEEKLPSRPSDPIRMGYLLKLDVSAKDIGDDSWISQYCTLEIAAGMFKYHAEIGGRRLVRGTIDIKAHIARPFKKPLYGHLFGFELLKKTDDGNASEEVVIIFAAEDSQSLSYWLYSFEDCTLVKDASKPMEESASSARKSEEESLAEKAMNDAESAISRSIFGAGPSNQGALAAAAAAAAAKRNNNPRQSTASILDILSTLPAPARLDSGFKDEPQVEAPTKQVEAPAKQVEATVIVKSTSTAIERNEVPPAAKINSNDDKVTLTVPAESIRPVHIANNPSSLAIQAAEKSFFPSQDVTASHERSASEVDDLVLESQPKQKELHNLTVKFAKTIYSAKRLARRIKIWYSSSGFSLSSDLEIQQFIRELKVSDDPILVSFSQEKFEYLNDWAKLLEALRKHEEKVVSPKKTSSPAANAMVTFQMNASAEGFPNRTSLLEIDENFSLDSFVNQLARDFGVAERSVINRVEQSLVSKNSPLKEGLKTIGEDLTFAEDLVLYQEEVIEHMWESYSALKRVVERKDEVITQLYAQLSDLQDRIRNSQLTAEALHGHVSPQLFSPGKSSAGATASAVHSPNPREMIVIADREFNIADNDGDGRISREEWRKWIQDKYNLVQEHSHVKTMLMEEIKILRKSLTPASEEAFNELKKSEGIRKQQEEDLIRANIERDELKDEIAKLTAKVRELEEEKTMIESDWKDRYESLQQKSVSTAAGAGAGSGSAAGNPYTYNQPEDQAIGLGLQEGKPTPISHSAADYAIDLQALAELNGPLTSHNLQLMGQNGLYGGAGSGNRSFYNNSNAASSVNLYNFDDTHQLEFRPPEEDDDDFEFAAGASLAGSYTSSHGSHHGAYRDAQFFRAGGRASPAPHSYPEVKRETGSSSNSLSGLPPKYASQQQQQQQRPVASNHPLRSALRNDIRGSKTSPFSPLGVALAQLQTSASARGARARSESPMTYGRSTTPKPAGAVFFAAAEQLQEGKQANRHSSPQRFMQSTETWKKRATPDKLGSTRSTTPDSIRVSNWKL